MMHNRSQDDRPPGRPPNRGHSATCACTTNLGRRPRSQYRWHPQIFDPIEAVIVLCAIPVPVCSFGRTIPVLVSAIGVESTPEGRGEGAELYPTEASFGELDEVVRSASLELDDDRL